MGSICTQICGENSVKRMGKTGLEISKILTPKQVTRPPIYRPEKYSRWDLSVLTVDRPVDRPTVIFWPVGATGRPSGRPRNPESRTLCSGRPYGRPDHCADNVHKSVHVGRPYGRPDLAAVDRPVDRFGLSASPRSAHKRDLKIGLLT